MCESKATWDEAYDGRLLPAERGSDAESLARQIAYIIGPSSAAQSAINELERKRRTGQPAYIHKVGNSWIVQTVRPNAEVSNPPPKLK